IRARLSKCQRAWQQVGDSALDADTGSPAGPDRTTAAVSREESPMSALTKALTIAAVAPTILTSSVACAQPPGFPDMSGYADVTNDFAHNDGRGTGVRFSTPDGGFSCGFGMPVKVTPDSQLVTCNGQLPGVANLPIQS